MQSCYNAPPTLVFNQSGVLHSLLLCEQGVHGISIRWRRDGFTPVMYNALGLTIVGC